MTGPEAVCKVGGAGVLAGALLAGLAGLPAGWAVLVAGLVAALVLVNLVAPKGCDPVWMPAPDTDAEPTAPHAASLAGRLFESAEQPDRFRTRIQPRLRVLALARLRRAGVEELTDPRAIGLLGPKLHSLVTDADATVPDPRTAAALFARLYES